MVAVIVAATVAVAVAVVEINFSTTGHIDFLYA